MNFINNMKSKAKELSRSLVLPEGEEIRTIEAASIILKEKIAKKVILLGDEHNINTLAKEKNIDISQVTIINPEQSPNLEAYTKEFYEMRKHKGINEEEALKAMKNPLNYASMMLHLNEVHALVAGAENTTGNVLRSLLTIVKTAKNTKTMSSYFIMDIPNREFGENGLMLFSDCATIPNPNAEQLSDIAIASAKSWQQTFDSEARVAMLSFSTKGSANHPDVDKVIEATKITQEKDPNLSIDGELQLDAAIVANIASKKAPDSKVAGKANILIFPDLGAGNIGYKLVQRLAKAEAYGPFLQGLAKPASDLSRGCSVDDIVNTSAVTLTQS